jgi:hypothetical protein
MRCMCLVTATGPAPHSGKGWGWVSGWFVEGRSGCCERTGVHEFRFVHSVIHSVVAASYWVRADSHMDQVSGCATCSKKQVTPRISQLRP